MVRNKWKPTIKRGNRKGLATIWHENGQKEVETNYKEETGRFTNRVVRERQEEI